MYEQTHTFNSNTCRSIHTLTHVQTHTHHMSEHTHKIKHLYEHTHTHKHMYEYTHK